MPQLRALQPWADRKQGEVFDASDEDARILCAPDLPGGQKAERLDAARIEAAAMTAEEAPALVQPAGPSKKGRYMRRDMRAQE